MKKSKKRIDPKTAYTMIEEKAEEIAMKIRPPHQKGIFSRKSEKEDKNSRGLLITYCRV